MPRVDEEIEKHIEKELEYFKQKYDAYPKITLYSCYCCFVYERNAQGQAEVGTDWAEDHIIDAFICPLHRSINKKIAHHKSIADCRKIENRFAGIKRELTDKETALLVADRVANRKKCCEMIKAELAKLR